MESRPAGIKRGLLGSTDTDLLNRKKENVSSEHVAINKKQHYTGQDQRLTGVCI